MLARTPAAPPPAQPLAIQQATIRAASSRTDVAAADSPAANRISPSSRRARARTAGSDKSGTAWPSSPRAADASPVISLASAAATSRLALRAGARVKAIGHPAR
ncbi:MAG: hypothetical protein ABSA02_37970 [Trebonia sp.]